MSPQDREYLRERASIERELAKSAPEASLQILHLEIAARYDAIVRDDVARPKLTLVSSR
jgi:hypothetical protein